MNGYIPSFAVKLEARKALQGHWQTALLVSFCAGILNTVSQIIGSLNNSNMASQMLIILQRDIAPDVMLDQMLQVFESSNMLSVAVSSLLAFLITPALSMGANAYYLKRMTGQPTQFQDLFSRLNIFFKSLGLSLLIFLRMLLWAMAPMVPVIALAYLFPSMSAQAFQILFPLATLASSILSILASLRYSQAVYVMAWRPETGVLASIRESKGLMLNRKGSFVMLSISFIGWSLLISVAGTLLSTMLGNVIASAAMMFANLALGVYISASKAGFYLHAAGVKPQGSENEFAGNGRVE